MSAPDPKDTLLTALQRGREALLWKLEGLSEYDARRPMTPTGTNLLGLVKHLAGVELGYFGEVFGRPSGEPMPMLAEDAEPDADMWATADESREQVVALYRRAGEHTAATVAALDLDAPGRVPWWDPRWADVTLHQVLVHVVAETHRHAGHADVLRELVDGAAGLRPEVGNLSRTDPAQWQEHRERLEREARRAAGTSPAGGSGPER